MEREGSMGGLSIDFDKLSLEKGRPLDVEDLDDDAWAAASDQKKIVELGSLGEGAGGAVTRCKLEQGQTVFALKVSSNVALLSTSLTDHRLLQPPLTQMSRSRSSGSSSSIRIVYRLTSANTTAPSWTRTRALSQ